MRFCLVSTQPDWGGGEKLLWSLGCALAEQNHVIAWIVRQGTPLERLVQSQGAPILWATRGRGFDPRQWLSVRSALAAWSPDTMLLNDTHSIMLGGSTAMALGTRRPLRMALRHTIFPVHSPLKLKSMSDIVVCVSQAARQVVLEAGLRPERTAVIYGGCEPIELDSTARRWANEEFQVAADAPLIICIGNLLECKGHLPLLDAMASLAKSEPHARLLIAGEGPLRKALEERIQQFGLANTVQLLGFRKDADRLLSAADIVVHPSLQEGLSLVMIQAQQLRKRIVSTGVGGTAEVLGLNEPVPSPAWIAAPGNATDLADKLQQAIAQWRSPRSSEFEAQLAQADARVRLKFDISRSAARLAELAEQMQRGARKKTA